MPDANKENTLNQLVGAAFGAAGQRCMALSTAILVGEARSWLPELVERAKALRVDAGTTPHRLHLGLSCSPERVSPKVLFGFIHLGATHTALTSPLALWPVVTSHWESAGLVESAMLQICGQICGSGLNGGLEDQIL